MSILEDQDKHGSNQCSSREGSNDRAYPEELNTEGKEISFFSFLKGNGNRKREKHQNQWQKEREKIAIIIGSRKESLSS